MPPKFTDVNVKDIPCADDIFRDKLLRIDGKFSLNRLGDFSVKEWSDDLGKFSRIQLYRKIKSLFGPIPNDLTTVNFRLKAKHWKLIATTKNFTSGVKFAYMVGFTSPAYFFNVLRKKKMIALNESIWLNNNQISFKIFY